MAWERFGTPLSSSRVRERDDDDAMILGLTAITDSGVYVPREYTAMRKVLIPGQAFPPSCGAR